MPGAGELFDFLAAAGGTLALSFIVALALGINALTLLFVGSSVVVLERFAREARRWRLALGIGVLWALPVTALALDAEMLAQLGVSDADRLRVEALAAAIFAAVILVAIAAAKLTLSRVSPSRLGALTLGVLGAGYALLVGGTERVGYAAAPVLVAGLAAGALRLRRRRRGGGRSEAERLLVLLCGLLGIGIVAALALPEPSPRLAAAGAGILGLVFAAVVLGLLPLAAAGLLEARGSAEWFIAVRYLVAKRRQTFISIITLICVGGVAAGVWLIITVLSVMNGFERTWREEIIGNRAHLTVHSVGPFDDYGEVLRKITSVPDVVAASPYVDAEGLVQGGGGVRVRGIDPERVVGVTELDADVVAGSLDDLAPLEPGADGLAGAPGILIGSQLAAGLGYQVGDPLLLISPVGGPRTPLGPAPRLFRFRVAGIFDARFFQFDELYTYVTIPAAQEFQRSPDVVDGIEVRVTDFYRSQQVAERIEAVLGPAFFARDWKEFVPAFFQALKTERIMMFVLLTMIMVVAAFVIVATLIMMIMEKSSDIAILKAMGAEDSSIERIFAIEGTLIGLAGTALGIVAGIAVTTQLGWVQTQVERITGIDTLPASVYQLSTLPWEIDPGQIAVIAAIALVLSLGATLLPSRSGARLDPAEALRYE